MGGLTVHFTYTHITSQVAVANRYCLDNEFVQLMMQK
jgi:hypothetical protein